MENISEIEKAFKDIENTPIKLFADGIFICGVSLSDIKRIGIENFKDKQLVQSYNDLLNWKPK
jgi:hypothetical protein